MRPMMRLFLGLVALVGIMAAVAIGLPAHVTVARSVVINAPESAVFPYLNEMRRFEDWSPWQQRDPKLDLTFSGPAQGKGAQVDWTSDVRSIGTGSMEITESEPNRNIDLVVDFNGLEGTSSYDIAPSGSGSKVTWSFGYETGTSPFKRWKGLMLDGLVGAEYRAGLDKLKERIETERRPTAPAIMTPPVGEAVEGQPSAALPPGATLPGGAPGQPGDAGGPGASVPMGAVPPAAGEPGAPAAGAAPEAAEPQTAEPAQQAVTPAPAPRPKRQQRRRSQR
jgi:hypothetical protein